MSIKFWRCGYPDKGIEKGLKCIHEVADIFLVHYFKLSQHSFKSLRVNKLLSRNYCNSLELK